MRLGIAIFSLLATTNAWYYGRPDPGSSTQGGVWPLPWTISYDTYNHTINPGQFHFVSKVGTCEIIDKATARYQNLSFPLFDPSSYTDTAATLTTLTIAVAEGCTTDYPQLGMDESYNLVVDKSKGIATLTANQVWGALRGLETFSQLIYQPIKNRYRIRTVSISDSPRFPHRGVMIDSSRHFLPVGIIVENLDLMAQNKLNVLHWHLVDSEAFPYTSMKFPNMSQLGAYSQYHIYSIGDIRKVMDYARLRGIRVVPEFDTPGHTGAWGKAFPNLLSLCYNSKGFISELSNILDPTQEATFTFLSDFFTEALALFRDNYMHFGGDEVSSDMQQCWANNADVTARMKKMGYSSTSDLLNYYWQRLFTIIDQARPGTKKVVWQEVLDMNVPATGSIAHVWKGGSIDDIMSEMASVTANGHKAILSSCWYLNYIKYGADWGYVDNSNMRLRGMYYECDPTNFQGTAAQKALVLGGEAAMWGEFVDATNLIPRLWPRASAVAERLWSDPAMTQSADAAWPRLHEFRCRMMNRGFPVQPPNNPDYCPFEWNPNYNEI
uniref:Beta-hexosaminidase n=1 Tax=Haemonchus contortus TaxID=6289 RepID=A0A7I4YUJ2_HAECO